MAGRGGGLMDAIIMTEDALLAFLDWMDGRGIAVTDTEASLRLDIA